MKARITNRRTIFKLLKYSRIVLINAETSRNDSFAPRVGANNLPRRAAGPAARRADPPGSCAPSTGSEPESEQPAQRGQREVDRERGDRDPHHRVDLPALAPHQLDERVSDEARRDPVGDRVR